MELMHTGCIANGDGIAAMVFRSASCRSIDIIMCSSIGSVHIPRSMVGTSGLLTFKNL